MPRLLVFAALLSLALLRPAWAETLGGALSPTSPAFEGYRYAAYNFEAPAGNALITVRSSAFDSYLLLLGPQGQVLTNDDHSMAVTKLGSDAGLALPEGSTGTWIVVATTYSPDSIGAFEVYTEGLQPLVPVSDSVLDRETLASAFAGRGILDQEAVRRDSIAAAAERLSLQSYRDDLTRQLQNEISRNEFDRASTESRLQELENKETELLEALKYIESLSSSNDLVRVLVDRELSSNRSLIDSIASTASDELASVDASRAAISEIEELNVISGRLGEIEEALLQSDTPQKIQQIRPELLRERQNFETLANSIAEKLLDLGILDHLQFGSLLGTGRPTGGNNSQIVFNSGELMSGMILGLESVSGGGGGGAARLDPSVYLPQVFPWPPPDASARCRIDSQVFAEAGAATLGGVADLLADALAQAGYTGPGYLGVPSGFAMVTRIEQTDGAGQPLAGEARWATRIAAVKSFTIGGYLRALLTSEPGYFRVIVIIVTDERFSMNGARGRLETLERWSRQGLDALVPEIRATPFTDDHVVSALVYEFEKPSKAADPEVRLPGRNDGPTHLSHTRFAGHLL